MSITPFPAEVRRQVELYRAWKAALEAGENADAIWREFVMMSIPPEQREFGRKLYDVMATR